ncbi:hemolysin III family protein [Enterococcus raffinosus]|uniref:PAQR family membrane homeostasis protein TrhA n=1 Tax=Enterococcus raffinosus TaxID=71452 RepID=UPI001C10F784|nr:hemolysin III family protein [Enterococcus raffinosus]MBU5361124.1 hemolysin III family protein [Enterococcus raffinosus]
MEKKQFYCSAESITSGLLHLWGVLLSIGGTVLLILFSVNQEAPPIKLVSFCIYGASLILLFSASTIYHIFYISPTVHRRLRKVDHSMVFCLIAGSYTPICLLCLKGLLGWISLILIWSMALVGIIGKIFWFKESKWFSATIYLIMGWGIVLLVKPLSESVAFEGIVWLFVSGILYSIGAFIYASKKCQFQIPGFGSHELFHLFVLAGAASHYYMIFQYVL